MSGPAGLRRFVSDLPGSPTVPAADPGVSWEGGRAGATAPAEPAGGPAPGASPGRGPICSSFGSGGAVIPSTTTSVTSGAASCTAPSIASRTVTVEEGQP